MNSKNKYSGIVGWIIQMVSTSRKSNVSCNVIKILMKSWYLVYLLYINDYIKY